MRITNNLVIKNPVNKVCGESVLLFFKDTRCIANFKYVFKLSILGIGAKL